MPDRSSSVVNRPKRIVARDGVSLYHGNALDLYERWDEPTCIMADGPYGVRGYPGDPSSHKQLPEIYRPHIEAWTRHSTHQTTLWFWNTEVGWAVVHPVLEEFGWEYRGICIWDKGLAHVSGRTNSQTLRKFPVSSEAVVQYIRPARFVLSNQEQESLTMQDWLRQEWSRTGLPMYRANEACGVANAASRKYLTPDHLWYPPPPEMFERMVRFANEHGDPAGRPYFAMNGVELGGSAWEKLQAKFYCPLGVTNVWSEPPIRGDERIKDDSGKPFHTNQKPLRLMERIIQSCTDEGDLVWEPFGGLCSASIAAHRLNRRAVAAEILPDFYEAAVRRLKSHDRAAQETSGSR